MGSWITLHQHLTLPGPFSRLVVYSHVSLGQSRMRRDTVGAGQDCLGAVHIMNEHSEAVIDAFAKAMAQKRHETRRWTETSKVAQGVHSANIFGLFIGSRGSTHTRLKGARRDGVVAVFDEQAVHAYATLAGKPLQVRQRGYKSEHESIVIQFCLRNRALTYQELSSWIAVFM